MAIHADTFFSWTLRRVVLPRPQSSGTGATTPRSGLAMDRVLQSGSVPVRLLAYHDTAGGADYVVLVVGDVVDTPDVPVRFVSEECLIVLGRRSIESAEILVGVKSAGNFVGEKRALIRQLSDRGPLWSLLLYTAARSVTVECHPVERTLKRQCGCVSAHMARPRRTSAPAGGVVRTGMRSCNIFRKRIAVDQDRAVSVR